jgi:hypothetical protein
VHESKLKQKTEVNLNLSNQKSQWILGVFEILWYFLLTGGMTDLTEPRPQSSDPDPS